MPPTSPFPPKPRAYPRGFSLSAVGRVTHDRGNEPVRKGVSPKQVGTGGLGLQDQAGGGVGGLTCLISMFQTTA
jgi:hypothetical protein